TLSAAYDQAVTMSFRTINGTATTSDGDYVPRTGTLTFAPGQTTKTITIEVKGDSKREANETFFVDLFGNSSNSLLSKNRGIGTILNDVCPAVLTLPCRPRVATATRGRLALSASVRHTDAFSDGASIAHFSGAKLPRRRALGQNSSADPPRSAATPFSQPPLVIRL